MEQKTKKKRFNQEFKDSAVKLVDSGRSGAQVARELGLEDWQVQTWVLEARKKKSATVGDVKDAEQAQRYTSVMRIRTKFAILLSCWTFAFAGTIASVSATEQTYKILGNGPLEGTVLCTMNLSLKDRKRLERQEQERRTVAYWCKINKSELPPQYVSVFQNNPASFIITFADKNGMGSVRPTSRLPNNVYKAALEIFQNGPVLTTPLTDEPYKRGRILRFSSAGKTVALAPRKF